MSEKRKPPITTLTRRKALALRALKNAAPVEFAAWVSAETAWRASRKGSGEGIFAKYRKYKDAFLELLKDGKWMTRDEIAGALIAGGMPGLDSEDGPRLAKKAVKTMIDRDQLVTRPAPSGNSKEELVGLPESRNLDLNR